MAKKPIDLRVHNKKEALTGDTKARKPIELRLPRKKAAPTSPLKLYLSILIIFTVVCAGAYYLSQKPSDQTNAEPELNLYLQASQPYYAGQPASISAYSSCGAFDVSLDGKKIASSENRAQQNLILPYGAHILEAKSSRCSKSFSFTVLQKECSGNESAGCFIGECGGTRECSNGFFGPCSLPKKICVPGLQIGCSVDGCKFGKTACNACGTGFGACEPVITNVSNSTNASGAACTGICN